MFDAARVLGGAVRGMYERDAEALKNTHRLQRHLHLRRPDRRRGAAAVPGLFGGQLHRGDARDRYFQIGETKYGKPIIDRVITPETPLAEATKCALVSLDSTIRSNLSVGLPLDLVVYAGDDLRAERVVSSTTSTRISR